MIDRRELVLGALVLGLPGGPSGPSVAPSIVLYDRRHRRSRAFALGLERRGALPLEIGADSAGLWRDRLRPLALAWPGLPLAGLTTRTDARVLAACAAGAGLSFVRSGRLGTLVSWTIT
jgi:hypothetical protein